MARLLVDLQRERGRGVADLIGDPVRVAARLRGEHRPGATQRVRRYLRERRESLLSSLRVCQLGAARQHAVAEAIGVPATPARGSEEVVGRLHRELVADALLTVTHELASGPERHLNLAYPLRGLRVRDLEARTREVDVGAAQIAQLGDPEARESEGRE